MIKGLKHASYEESLRAVLFKPREAPEGTVLMYR